MEEMTSQENSVVQFSSIRESKLNHYQTYLTSMCISIECITINKQGGVQVLFDTGAPCILQALKEGIIIYDVNSLILLSLPLNKEFP